MGYTTNVGNPNNVIWTHIPPNVQTNVKQGGLLRYTLHVCHGSDVTGTTSPAVNFNPSLNEHNVNWSSGVTYPNSPFPVAIPANQDVVVTSGFQIVPREYNTTFVFEPKYKASLGIHHDPLQDVSFIVGPQSVTLGQSSGAASAQDCSGSTGNYFVLVTEVDCNETGGCGSFGFHLPVPDHSTLPANVSLKILMKVCSTVAVPSMRASMKFVPVASGSMITPWEDNNNFTGISAGQDGNYAEYQSTPKCPGDYTVIPRMFNSAPSLPDSGTALLAEGTPYTFTVDAASCS